jgi:hypothetical protein
VNKISTGIPYLNFFFIWIICLTTAGESMSQLFYFFCFLCYLYLAERRAHKYLRLRLDATCYATSSLQSYVLNDLTKI